MTTNDYTVFDAAELERQVALVVKWERHADTGAETFAAAEYDELAVIFRHDARELAVVLDCRGLDYPVCRTCGNERVVTRELVSGTWASWYGPQVDYCETPCPDCADEAADWEPFVYDDDVLDAYLDGLYAQTRRDERAEVAA